MGRSDAFEHGQRPEPPPELAHMFKSSEHMEWSVVRASPRIFDTNEPPTRHGVYDNPGEAELHIAQLRVSGGAQPNLKVIMQPQGTAYRDLMEGRIKMLEGAPWPKPPKKAR